MKYWDGGRLFAQDFVATTRNGREVSAVYDRDSAMSAANRGGVLKFNSHRCNAGPWYTKALSDHFLGELEDV